ncbi:MAG: hypothetical protein HY033_05805 [Ignavibacteriae bacterium]|nr:hypothetical protein [Ignavibacteria bacterium]MBI3364405.1 hypothetical protein [Ignavibacteriota bacterium]
MKTLSFIILCFVLFPGITFSQKNNIAEFYARVDSICEFPAVDKGLVIMCQKKLMKRYITFVGMKGDSVARIVAVTLKPITDVNKNISLVVDFQGITPTPGKISTWGYIFDRNGDGKVDYMALVGGAAPFKPLDFPDDYPKKREPLTHDQIEYLVSHAKTIFNQWADDNYDDTLDAVIHISMDPERDWVDHRLLVRSKSFDKKFDDVRAFWTNLEQQQVAVEHTPTSVSIYPVGKTIDEEITQNTLDEKTRIMQLINQAVRECKIKPGQLMH